jgi:hypothetical protein
MAYAQAHAVALRRSPRELAYIAIHILAITCVLPYTTIHGPPNAFVIPTRGTAIGFSRGSCHAFLDIAT